MPQIELVLYSSRFCGACTLTRERIDLVVNAVGGRVIWKEIDVSDHTEAAIQAQVIVSPTVVITRMNGEEVTRAAGVPTIEQLLGAIASGLDVM